MDAHDEASAINALASLLARLRGPVDRFPHPTVRDAATAFLAAQERDGAAPKTLAAYRGRLKRLDGIADRPAAGVTPDECEAWLDGFAETAVSRASRARTLKAALCRAAPDFAPIRRWRVRKVRSPRRVLPDRDGIARWRAECRTAELRDVFDFLHATGARQDEARRLEARHVNRASRAVILEEHKTAKKTGRPRIIPIADDGVWRTIVALCEQHPAGPLYRNAWGRPWTSTGLSEKLGDAARRAGLDGVSGHCLRHRCAVDLLNAGVSPPDAAGVLGHTVEQLLKTYAHVSTDPSRLLEAARRRLGA